MTGILDKVIAVFSPRSALRREQYRRALAYYEAARPSRLRKTRTGVGTANQAVAQAGNILRERARYLEANYDIARGALSALARNIVGPGGIAVEPQPRLLNNSVHTDFARALRIQYAHWCKTPEVTGQHDYAAVQHLLCRSWLRDGEVFVQLVLGAVKTLTYGRVPLSLELIESDMLPLNYNDETKGIIQGILLNNWGRPRRYYFNKRHPADLYGMRTGTDTKSLIAERVLHLAVRDRIGQIRGVSIFAAVLDRLADVKDYEESERVAAKVAASMAAVIKKGAPDMYEADTATAQGERDMKFAPGMIFDDLSPGESVETIDSTRPNPGLEAFRQGQLRAVAAGLGTSYSTLARDYNGTYSAQRQELVEQWSAYATLSTHFINSVIRPVYENWIRMAILSKAVVVPPGLRPETIDDMTALAPQMPWIDPLKEMESWTGLERAGYASGIEIVRRRGFNPADVLEQERQWQEMLRDAGVQTSLVPGNVQQPPSKGKAQWQ